MRGLTAFVTLALVAAVAAACAMQLATAHPQPKEVVELRKQLVEMEGKDVDAMAAERARIQEGCEGLPAKELLACGLAVRLLESVRDTRHLAVQSAVSNSEASTVRYMLKVTEAYKRANMEIDAKLATLEELAQKISRDDVAEAVLRVLETLGNREAVLADITEREIKSMQDYKRVQDKLVFSTLYE